VLPILYAIQWSIGNYKSVAINGALKNFLVNYSFTEITKNSFGVIRYHIYLRILSQICY
jgi:hypothetical protein